LAITKNCKFFNDGSNPSLAYNRQQAKGNWKRNGFLPFRLLKEETVPPARRFFFAALRACAKRLFTMKVTTHPLQLRLFPLPYSTVRRSFRATRPKTCSQCGEL